MYKAIVKWNGNHYFAGQEIRGSKIRTNEDGTVELFDDEPIEGFPYYGSSNDTWVEVDKDSIFDLDKIE